MLPGIWQVNIEEKQINNIYSDYLNSIWNKTYSSDLYFNLVTSEYQAILFSFKVLLSLLEEQTVTLTTI